MPLEVEIKLRIGDLYQARARLSQIGFHVHKERALERNLVFNTEAGRLLRLRDFSGKNILTYKGPAGPGPHKSREEIEVEVSDAAGIQEILDRLGYRPVFIYEKYRAEYQRPGEPGIVTIDETPIGDFFEIEGAPEWIDRTAQELGRPPSEYITHSYGALFAIYRQETPGSPPNMVFPGNRIR
jgi:adenylate cyclase class 2